MTVHVMGIPHICMTDDILPFSKKNKLLFVDLPTSKALYVPYIEKCFAKVMGSYNALGWGWNRESFDFTTGMPSEDFSIWGKSINKDTDTVK